MDGLDLSAIDEIDQEAFNGSPDDSDEAESDMPLPDCIGIDSAIQDDEQVKKNQNQTIQPNGPSRSERERELELKGLRPDSIRGQILERSMNSGTKHGGNKASTSSANDMRPSHVMNIVEKAGMSGIDKERINKIIHEASKGSLFYKKQAQRQAEIHKSIEKMLIRVKQATPLQVANAKITCDKLVEELEKQQVFNRVIVHFDLDMFFAAVEIRDNPELADKPIAVGGDSMVSTSNYIARRFGVRAAMPGFIAKKLCPDLLLIKPNGFKYRQASSEVFSILEEYDPDLTGMSLDEAYLDLTEYVKNTLERDGLEYEEYYDGTLPKTWWTRANEVVEEIRQAIYDKTKLTCSAGVSCNTLPAKISTDINKPNGQFMVEGYPKHVREFIHKTPVEKVSGIGKVSVQFLNALDIKTCGDIFEKRHFLPLVFYEINVNFYLKVALGDGSTCIKSDEQRKSKSVERTFSAIKDTLILLDKLDSICEELCTKYLKPYRIRGRTITVKLKRNTFTTTTRSYSMLIATNDKPVIYSAAKNLLLSEIANEPPEISYRLLGVKLSNLADDGVTTNQLTIDAMLRNQHLVKSSKSESTVYKIDEIGDSSNGHGLEMMTQDEPIRDDSPIETSSIMNEKDNDSDVASVSSNGSVKRKATQSNIKGFFAKYSCKEDQETTSSSKTVTKKAGIPFHTQEEEEQFFDIQQMPMEELMGPNEMSQREQEQNAPNDEDFRCPYCFKPFAHFNNLEAHVDRCYLKTSYDVNKTFFSQRPAQQPIASQVITPPPSTQRSSARNKTSGKSQAKRSKVNKAVRLTQTRLSFTQTSTQHQNNPSPNPTTPKTQPKQSFYQRFIESNSTNLSQSPKIDPMQCPYCIHGFLNFSELETHVSICTKRKLPE